MKLSTRVALLLSVAIMTVCVAFAAWVHVTTTSATHDAVRRAAYDQLQVAQRSLAVTGTLPDFAVIDDAGIPAPLRAAVSTSQQGSYLERQPPVVWAAVKLSSGSVLAVRLAWDDSADMIASLDRTLAAGVGVTALVSAALAALVGRQLGRRLNAAERAAARIADGDLGVQVGAVVGGRDEVAQLARTIDTLTARAQARLESEKRVTADIAHDLRTPLTSLVTAVELLPDDRASRLVRTQVQRLWRLVEDLLEVARLDAAEQHLEIDAISVAALARAAVAGSALPDLEPVIAADAVVCTDARRAQRVLVNLLNNAAAHGSAPYTVTVEGRRITIDDHGAGFPPDLLAHGPTRFKTGAPERGTGHGLGLTIALGQARAIGAQITFRNTDDGARAEVLFPEGRVADDAASSRP